MSGGNRKAYLTIRFEGPNVKAGRMRLTDFVQAAKEFTVCAQRVGLALQQAPSFLRGRRSASIEEALSLDLVAFTEGSPAAVAHLERSDNQMNLESMDFGDHAYRALLEGMESVIEDTAPLPTGFDLGVLLKLRDLGALFRKGVARVEFSLDHRPCPVKAVYDPPHWERVRARIARPEAQLETRQGRLLMADFKETGRVLRIHPAVGSPIACEFPEELSSEVGECLRQFVRVTGKMEYHETGEPRRLRATDVERIEPPLASGTTSEPAAWSYDYWENPSAEEYARRQGIKPVTDFEALLGGWPEEYKEDGFEETVEKWRSESPVI